MKDIILTGQKHCGKTSAGKILASLLSCGFFDIDELIFKNTGKKPRQLFKESPELFKKAETEAAVKLFDLSLETSPPPKLDFRVIACGGGLIDNSDAVKVITASGAIKVFLEVSADTAWERILREKELPSFIDPANPQKDHLLIHERRSAAYRQFADIVIDADKKTPEETASEIVSIISINTPTC